MSDTTLSECDTAFAKRTIRESFPAKRYGGVFAAQYEAFSFMVKQEFRKKVTLRRVRAMWEGKASRIDGEEKDALRRAKIEEAQRERNELRQRLERLDQELAVLDA